MESLEGMVEGILYRNEENGYTVAVVDDEHTVVGCMPLLAEGQPVRFQGSWSEHKRYGRQFNVASYEELTPRSEDELERYLSAGIIKGVGPATARAIVLRFGMDAFDAIKDPKVLSKIPGIGKLRAQKISESFLENEQMRESLMFFQKYGLSVNKAVSVFKVYGKHSVNIASANPYALIEQVEGIGFTTVDKMALSMGMAHDDPFRISAAFKHELYEAANQGHAYLPFDQLVVRVEALCRTRLDEEQLARIRRDRSVIFEEPDKVYLPWCYDGEKDIAYRLHQICEHHRRLPEDDIGRKIKAFERQQHIKLADEQVAAVNRAVGEGVFVLTGGPGTGKTTTLNCIIDILQDYGLEVVLAAPTGRAAKRITETTGVEAKTIHRLLEYNVSEGKPYFSRNFNRPLEGDVFIIDEMSMVDISLMRSLLFALPDTARLILVGDADQLPSIGPGCVLRDLIESGCVAVTALKEIFRQAADSVIVVNAHRINQGQPPLVDSQYQDFKLVERYSRKDIVSTVVKLCAEFIPQKFHIPPEEIQVLSPNRKQEDGVINLNKLLQEALNPPEKGKSELNTGLSFLRQGDKVMQIRNNYQLPWKRYMPDGTYQEGEGVFNGDMGRITHIGPERTVEVLFDDQRVVEYDSSALDDIVNAYAISIHKSQGCEFPCVVIPISEGSAYLYNRNLLYTAVTRAKGLCVLVGQMRDVENMVRNVSIQRRYSQLADRLRQQFKEPCQ